MPSHARDSQLPPASPLRPKAIGTTSGTYAVPAWARKPALARREPERLAREQRMAAALGFTMQLLGLSDGAVGEFFGVNATCVRAMRRREKPIQLEKLYRSSTPEAEMFRASLLDAIRAALLDNPSANDG